MKHRASRAFPDLSGTTDAELIDGSRGVFASNWNDAKEPPEATGSYLVTVRANEPVVALFIKGQGWDLSDTRHTGLEERIAWWMDLPRGPR